MSGSKSPPSFFRWSLKKPCKWEAKQDDQGRYVCYASVNSSWASRPGLPQAGGRAFANFALPGGRAFANPRAIPKLLIRAQFPIRIQLHREFNWKNKHIGLIVKDTKKLKRLVKTCSRFYACIFSLLIKPESQGEIGSYQDVNQRFSS